MNFRVLATILVIAAGLAGSYFILKTPLPALKKSGDVDLKKPSDFISQNPNQWFEKVSEKLDQEVKNLNENKTSGGDDSSNATKKVAQAFFENMKEKDQAGQNPFGISSASPDDPQNKKIIEEILGAFASSDASFNVEVPYQDLKIIQNNSQEVKLKYLKDASEISQKNLSNPKFQRTSDQLMADINSDCFGPAGSINKELSQAYKNTADDYLRLETPSEWALLQKNIIVYFKKADLIYGGIANCLNDPIKGYAAVKKLPEVMVLGQEIQAELTEKSKLVGI